MSHEGERSSRGGRRKVGSWPCGGRHLASNQLVARHRGRCEPPGGPAEDGISPRTSWLLAIGGAANRTLATPRSASRHGSRAQRGPRTSPAPSRGSQPSVGGSEGAWRSPRSPPRRGFADARRRPRLQGRLQLTQERAGVGEAHAFCAGTPQESWRNGNGDAWQQDALVVPSAKAATEAAYWHGTRRRLPTWPGPSPRPRGRSGMSASSVTWEAVVGGRSPGLCLRSPARRSGRPRPRCEWRTTSLLAPRASGEDRHPLQPVGFALDGEHSARIERCPPPPRLIDEGATPRRGGDDHVVDRRAAGGETRRGCPVVVVSS